MDTSYPGDDWSVTSCAGLVALLRTQHEELAVALSRLPDMSGAAREDEFLHVRRQLAVHHALEAELVRPRLAGDETPRPTDVRAELISAEAQAASTSGFEAAITRVLATHLRHAEVQESSTFEALAGELAESERAVAGTAIALWRGEGEAYLGNDYAAMLETAHQQLSAAAGRDHTHLR